MGYTSANNEERTIGMNDDEDRKPCPCCGSGAYFDMVESDGLIDGRAGGWFVECNNSECRLTTQLMFATGDDPRPRLREIWNKRHNAELTRLAACGQSGGAKRNES